jgi:hypothetical protein
MPVGYRVKGGNRDGGGIHLTDGCSPGDIVIIVIIVIAACIAVEILVADELFSRKDALLL